MRFRRTHVDDAPTIASTFIRGYFIESIGAQSCNKEAARKLSKRATLRADETADAGDAEGLMGPRVYGYFCERSPADRCNRAETRLVANRGVKKSVGRARQKWLSLPRVEENLRVYTGVIICAYLGTLRTAWNGPRERYE